MSYDTKCLELAEAFMSDYPKMRDREKRTKAIAQAIQNAIEDELSDFEREDEAQHYRVEYDSARAAAGFPEPMDPRSQDFAEQMREAADYERKRLREEG